jgi:hypothetical protein
MCAGLFFLIRDTLTSNNIQYGGHHVKGHLSTDQPISDKCTKSLGIHC